MIRILNIKALFIVLFVLLTSYYLFIKAELYESKTALIVRDLSSSSSPEGFGLSLLGMGPSSQLQDSLVVEEYLLSLDVFTLLDDRFQLSKHFKSDQLDMLERLSSDAPLEKVLEFYHQFNRRKARKQLKFIELQYEKSKKQMEISSAELERYQNKHLLLDPNNNALSSSTIISSLEASLSEKKIELSMLRDYLNEEHYEITKVKSEIRSREQSIVRQKKALSGNDSERLNKTLFEYGRLKMAVEFDVEVYKNILIQRETTKLEAAKEAKTLSVVIKPNLPDGYTYPDRPKVFMTILIVILLSYSIISMLAAIIRDHKE